MILVSDNATLWRLCLAFSVWSIVNQLHDACFGDCIAGGNKLPTAQYCCGLLENLHYGLYLEPDFQVAIYYAIL